MSKRSAGGYLLLAAALRLASATGACTPRRRTNLRAGSGCSGRGSAGGDRHRQQPESAGHTDAGRGFRGKSSGSQACRQAATRSRPSSRASSRRTDDVDSWPRLHRHAAADDAARRRHRNRRPSRRTQTVVDTTSTVTGVNAGRGSLQPDSGSPRLLRRDARRPRHHGRRGRTRRSTGRRGAENQYIIDGLNTTGIELGDKGKTLNFDFVQEVEVKTGGMPAEYGRMTGGVINVITKSGSNSFKGSGFG